MLNKYKLLDAFLFFVAVAYFIVNYYQFEFVLNLKMVFIIVMAFMFLHFIKLIRIYMIFINENIGIFKITQIYCLTTLINIISPYRIGEFYRVFCYGRNCSNYKIGVIGIVIDRFFDSLILVLLLYFNDGIFDDNWSLLSFMLVLFIFASVFIFIFFPQMYEMLNTHLISNKPTKRSLVLLTFLNNFYDWHDLIKKVINGKIPFLIICSVIAWAAEYIVLSYIFGYYQLSLNFSSFINYIDNKSYQVLNNVLNSYTVIHVYTMASFIGILTLYKRMKAK